MKTATKEHQCKKNVEYKESGIDWLGRIPEQWRVLPGLSFITQGKDKNIGMKRNKVLSLSYGNIRVKEQGELTGLVPESFETYQFVNKGDLIFRPTDLQNDKVSLRSSISEYDGIITSAYLNLRFKTQAHPKYYHYLFRAIDNNKVIYGLGSGLRQNIDYRDFRRFKFPFPVKSEQIAIANFLDMKTAQIETAIDQKEKLIALLKERKQIIIQDAVTKGLDPKVKMKDSGVEWIDEIPLHWASHNFRYLIEVLTDYTANGSFASLAKNVTYLDRPSYSRLIRLTDLRSNFDNDGVYLDEKSHKYLKKSELFGGELLIANVGAYAGLACIMPHVNYPASLAPNMFLLKIKKGIIDANYIKHLINSQYFWRYIQLIAKSAAQPKLNKEDIRKIQIIYPPLYEQIEIVRHIESESKKLDEAIGLQEKQIIQLEEFKSVLIDNAVTGKIKVFDRAE